MKRAMTKHHMRPKARARGKGDVDLPNPADPAPTIARSPHMERVERGARNLNFVLKKLALGPQAALDALNRIRDGCDPREYSEQAIVDVRTVDGWIDHSKSFSGR